MITVRLYGPTDELSNGDWVYPKVTKIDPITALDAKIHIEHVELGSPQRPRMKLHTWSI